MMRFALYDTFEAYEAKVTAINEVRGYPNNGTERYADIEEGKMLRDVDGKYVLPVDDDLEYLFDGTTLHDQVTYPPSEE